MAAYYLDSSGLVKRYGRETGTAWISGIADAQAGHELFVSLITGAEVAAAIAKQRRLGTISPDDAAQATKAFKGHFQSQYIVAAVSRAIVDRAIALAESYGLRGYDAVQLATALEIHVERTAAGLPHLILISADDDLNAAAAQEGFTVENPNAHPHVQDFAT